MTRQENAQHLFDELNLPDDASAILGHPKYWNIEFCRLYLERCEDVRFEQPRAGLRMAKAAPTLAYRIPRHQCGGESGWCSLQVEALGVIGSAHHNLAFALVHLEGVDLDEALDWLRKAQEMNCGEEESLTGTKLLWAEGRALVRMGRTPEAQEAFETVRCRLGELGAPFDAALATVELTKICFEAGETARVKELAGELFPLFRALRADDDAYEALRLFQQAAFSESLNAEVFRRVEEELRRRASAFWDQDQ